MSNTTITPNMNLIVPTPGIGGDPGPDYAYNQNQDLLILDSHNHSPGSGVQITPAGLNINTNLPFNGNSATSLYGAQFSNPTSSALLTFLYTNSQSGGGITDLFYNDGAGNVIALTKAGAVNATIASLPGESYSGGTFTWKQGAGSTTPANFDIGSVTIRPNTAATTNGVVLGPPSGIASQYNVQLPTLPGSTLFMTLDTSGNMSTASNIQPTQIAANSITRQQLVAVGQQISGSCNTFNQLGPPSGTIDIDVNNLSVTLTTTGRPVIVILNPLDNSYCLAGVGSNATATTNLAIKNGSGDIAGLFLNVNSIVGASAPNSSWVSYPQITTIDTPAAGTITYTAYVTVGPHTFITLNNYNLIAYEL